jgi:hypothetical protein
MAALLAHESRQGSCWKKSSVEAAPDHSDAPRILGNMYWRSRISTDPNVCHGKARISGTRIMVSVVLDNLRSSCHRFSSKLCMQYFCVSVIDAERRNLDCTGGGIILDQLWFVSFAQYVSTVNRTI